jgi:hypothetical protein
MAMPANTVRNVIRGTLAGGEIFQTSFMTVGLAPTSEDLAQAYSDSLRDRWLAHLPTLLNMINSGCAYDGVTIYAYPAGGTAATFTASTDFATPQIGTGNAILPDQVCLVMTLLTGAAGRRNRGRMYLPATGVTMAAGGLVSATQVATWVTGVESIFSDINGQAPNMGGVSVVSNVGTTSRLVTSVRSDQRADIQRRRANKQVTGATSEQPVAPYAP